jgi:hypothetical protein
MKTKIQMLLVLSFLLLLGSGCKKEAAATAAAGTGSGTTTVTRDLFRLWTTSNGSHTYDLRLGNLVASNFNAYVTVTSGDVCTCVTNISGAQDFGGYSSTCSLTTNVTGYTCSVWNTTDGGATYTNSAGTLTIKRSTLGSPFDWPN